MTRRDLERMLGARNIFWNILSMFSGMEETYYRRIIQKEMLRSLQGCERSFHCQCSVFLEEIGNCAMTDL